jgi:dTDP-glucose 4,6-dehydratase
VHKKLPKILVTGGAGFIGSEFVRQGVQRGYPLVVADKLTYAGDLKRLDEVKRGFKFYKADVCSVLRMGSIFKKEKPRIVVHFAAESHVDRSICDASPFIEANIVGTQALLDISRKYGVERFVHISTDEVYGDIRKGRFKEISPLHPNSPYAASKASADLLIKAAARTHAFPAIIVRPSNNYGPWQYPEKLIPVVILKAQEDQLVPVYSRGENVREWLHVSDCVRAVFLVMEKGKEGEIYNVGSGQEKKNIETVKMILKHLGKGPDFISFVKDRPGHDFRYAMDCSMIRASGWRPLVDFDEGLKQTVSWNLENFSWLSGKLRSLKAYWKKVY